MAGRSRQSEASDEGGKEADGATASKPPTEGERLDTGNDMRNRVRGEDMAQIENGGSSTSVHAIVLLPCPFCGSRAVVWTFVEDTGEGYHHCDGCGCRGPSCFHGNEDLANSYWNKRSVSDSATIVGAEAFSDVVTRLVGFDSESRKRIIKAASVFFAGQ